MNIARIVFKELKMFRDIRLIIFMLATPIVLILLLGTALTGVFDADPSLGDVRLLIHDESSERSLKPHLDSFVQQAEQAGVQIERAETVAGGQGEVIRGTYTGYVHVTDEGFDFFGSSEHPVAASIIHAMLSAAAENYKLDALFEAKGMETVPDMTSGKAVHFTGGDPESASEEGQNRAVRAIDYYAVAMTTLIIMYTAMTASNMMQDEHKRNTALRLLASPITKGEIFAGKIIGHFLIHAISILLVVMISHFAFGAYWGDQWFVVMAILFSQIVYALGLGLGASYVIRGNAAGAVVMIIIQVEAFIGGAYFPVDGLTGWMDTVSRLSPLRWTNDALLNVIYGNDVLAALPTAAFNVGVAVLLLSISLILLRRREGL